MGKINWGRVFLCGIVTGSVSALLQLLVFFFALPETEFAAAVEAARAGRPTVRALGLIVFFAVGILTIWLYAAIRPRYGPGPKTAVVAGFAVWLSGALVDIYWVDLRVTPFAFGALLAPLAVVLLAHIAATLLGAWQYKE